MVSKDSDKMFTFKNKFSGKCSDVEVLLFFCIKLLKKKKTISEEQTQNRFHVDLFTCHMFLTAKLAILTWLTN